VPENAEWYANENTLFELECVRRHAFGGTISVLRQGGWCPLCEQEEKRRAAERVEALMEVKAALQRAALSDDSDVVRAAIEAAAAAELSSVYDCASDLRRAQARLRELDAEAEQQRRCAALGVGGVPYPHDFICPVTQLRMADPVVASDGHTYERSAIERVLRDSGLSPLTREPLKWGLFPNIALRNRIRAYYGELAHVAEVAGAAATAAATAAAAAAAAAGAAAAGAAATATAAGGAASHSAEPSSRSGPAPAAEAQARTSAREDDVGEGRRMTRHRLKSSRKRSAAGPPE
jgi:hypothetical protein